MTKRRQAAQDRAAVAAAAVAPTVRDWWDKGSAYAGPRVDQAREWAGPRIEQARDWAAPRLEQAVDRSVELAAPRIEAAANALAPAIDATRDKLVDDVLPKVVSAAHDAAARVNQVREERLVGAADVFTGKAVAKPLRKKHRVARAFWVLSFLGAVGTAVFFVLRRRGTDVDPWAQPYPTYPPVGDSGDIPDEQQPETDTLNGVDTAEELETEGVGAEAGRDSTEDSDRSGS